MNSQTDQPLLREYAESRSEAAFNELVRRHVDFVYSAALRMVRDAHLAEDVTQGVFVALSENAQQLADRTVLSGWLHRTAQNIAAKAVRSDVRRRAREQEAAAMHDLLSVEPDPVWERIAPHLDAALGELSEPDRDVLLLRYFERKSARVMAQTLGTTDEAAQKRVTRAVERLRESFAKRGVTVGASGLVISIAANAVQAAPIGLSAAIAGAAAVAGTPVVITAASTATLAKTIAMTTKTKAFVAATTLLLCCAATFVATKKGVLRPLLAAFVKVDLDSYTGEFETPGHTLIIQKHGTGISVGGGADGGVPFVAYPESEKEFVSHDAGSLTRLTFERDASRRVTQFKLVRDGRLLGELKRKGTR